jgi:hypothetical protein
MKYRFLIPLLVLTALTAKGDTVTVAFPKDKPAFTIQVPKAFAVDATEERLLIKTRKERKTFFHLAAIPAADGVVDEATARAWLPKKAKSLLDTLAERDTTTAGVEEFFFGQVAGHVALEMRYDGEVVKHLKLWVFTPDGKRYFYAFLQHLSADSEETSKDREADISSFWPLELLKSITPVKK